MYETNNMISMVYEKMESYETNYLSNLEIITTLTGINPVLFSSKVEIYKSIQKACESAPYYVDEVTQRQSQKLVLLGELLKRNTTTSKKEKVKITDVKVIADLYMDEMKHLDKEHFDIVLLDTKCHVIKKINISIGDLNSAIVHPREVFTEAIKYKADSIILVHNHPSGDPYPSNEDINITYRLVDVGNLVKIKVLDHVIIGDNRYISFKEKLLI